MESYLNGHLAHISMKIAIFTDTFLPQVNGVVSSVLTLVKGLASKGHKVFIVAPKYTGVKEFSFKNVSVKRINSVPAFFYDEFKFASTFSPKLFKFLKKEKIDIVHFHTPILLGVQSIIISKLLKKPLVGTFHTFISDPQYLKHVKLDYNLAERVAWSYSNWYYNKCDLITSPSEYTKRELIIRGCKKNIKVISNGIKDSMFDNSDSGKVKKKYNPKGKLILFIGRIAHEKNLDYLLDCFSLAAKKLPNTKLLMVGNGPQFNEVKKKIRSLHLSGKVILTGRIDHSLLLKSGIFGACHLFVTASKTENQPMTVLESQQNGLVCVGLNEKGMSDLVKDGVNGYLFKEGDKKGFANAIVKLLTDNKLYTKMRKATFREIKKHSVPKVIDEWEETYANLIKKKSLANKKKKHRIKRTAKFIKKTYKKIVRKN